MFSIINNIQIFRKETRKKYTVGDILDTLRDMNVKLDMSDTYSPNYIRTDLTDDLHDKFGFRTDYEAIREKNLKKFVKKQKIKKLTHF